MAKITKNWLFVALMLVALPALPGCIEQLASEAELNQRIANHQGDGVSGQDTFGGEDTLYEQDGTGQDGITSEDGIASEDGFIGDDGTDTVDDIDTDDSGFSDGSGIPCQYGSDCNDNNPCTDDNCMAGNCSYAPHTGDNPCPEGQLCNSGYCQGVPGSICGDGYKQGSEQCDDGNSDPGDGCSACMLDVSEPSGMRFIPTGSFAMGCALTGGLICSGSSDEMPVHTVSLTAFFIDLSEVTAGAYKDCVDGLGCSTPATNSKGTYGKPDKAQHPMLFADYTMAATYCSIMGKRMCTEAEWEFAARGLDGRVFPWFGESVDCSFANIKGCMGAATYVGSYPPGDSQFGVQDLAGNVDEWVADYYGAYSSNSQSNPTGPVSGNFRVAKGGNWDSPGDNVRASARSARQASEKSDSLGFRCCKSLK